MQNQTTFANSSHVAREDRQLSEVRHGCHGNDLARVALLGVVAHRANPVCSITMCCCERDVSKIPSWSAAYCADKTRVWPTDTEFSPLWRRIVHSADRCGSLSEYQEDLDTMT